MSEHLKIKYLIITFFLNIKTTFGISVESLNHGADKINSHYYELAGKTGVHIWQVFSD